VLYLKQAKLSIEIVEAIQVLESFSVKVKQYRPRQYTKDAAFGVHEVLAGYFNGRGIAGAEVGLALGVLGGRFSQGMMNDSPKVVALDRNVGALIGVCSR
jgi:hypothetical protein